jgi:hypothetical protein
MGDRGKSTAIRTGLSRLMRPDVCVGKPLKYGFSIFFASCSTVPKTLGSLGYSIFLAGRSTELERQRFLGGRSFSSGITAVNKKGLQPLRNNA